MNGKMRLNLEAGILPACGKVKVVSKPGTTVYESGVEHNL